MKIKTLLLSLIACSVCCCPVWANTSEPIILPGPSVISEKIYPGLSDIPFSTLLEKAKKDDPEAMFELGRCYESGRGTAPDPKKAAKYYRLSADKGYSYGQAAYAICLLTGQGVKKDLKLFADYAAKAAQQDNSIGWLNLGNAYYNGWGVAVNHSKAAECYQKAAALGNISAKVNLGYFYSNGIGGLPRNINKAKQLLTEALEQGDRRAPFFLANIYIQRQSLSDLPQAADYLEIGVERDDDNSRCLLGNLYEEGLGRPQDFRKAAELYQTAASHNDPMGLRCLGRIYMLGHGVEQNSSKAGEYMLKAAQLGEPQAQYYCGVMHEEGNGLYKNMKLAVEFYEKAAKQGNFEAQYRLGMLYKRGKGVARNMSAAASYLQAAAQQGYQPAIDELNGRASHTAQRAAQPPMTAPSHDNHLGISVAHSVDGFMQELREYAQRYEALGSK